MQTAAFILAALSLWQGCNAQTEILAPLKPTDLGLQRRDGSTISLQNATQLLWGGTTQSVFANLTLQSGENELLLSTDYFSNELTSLTCTSDLSLTFDSEATFKAAIMDWSWVFPENRTFIMIVNYPGCTKNADNGRQLWVVSNIKSYDEINFIVNFEATLSNWTIIGKGHDFSLDFGSSIPHPSVIAARDTNYIVGSDILPRFLDGSEDKSIKISLAHNLPQSLYSKSLYGLDFAILCPGCETTGSVDIDGHIEYSPTGPHVITITATPQDVGLNLALGLQVSGTLGQGWGDSVFVVPEFGLPGWSIPDIFVFGPQMAVEVGFLLGGVQGEVTIQAGMSANIPNGASAVLGIKGKDSTSTGWTPTINYTPPSLDIEVDGTLELYTLLSLDLGVTVLNDIGAGAGIFLKLPDVKLTLGAEFNSAGVCGTSDHFGINFGATVGVDLELGVYTKDGAEKTWEYNHTIYQNHDLITPISECYPLGNTLSPSASGVAIQSSGTLLPLTTLVTITTSQTTTTAPPTITTSPPVNGTTSSPVNGTTSPPVNGTTHLPVNGTTSLPINGTLHLPVNGTTHLPVNGTTRLPVTGTVSLPVISTANPPVDGTGCLIPGSN